MSQRNETLPTVTLKPGESDRLIAGHPWIFQGNVRNTTDGIPDGAVVQVRDHRRRHLGCGLYNAKSKIRVRMLDRERQQINVGFFKHRFQSALAHRKRWLGDCSCFRLVSAEADQLSGLIIDIYGDTAILQITSLGIDQRKAEIIEALRETLEIQNVFERGDAAGRKFEGLPEFPLERIHGDGQAPAKVRVGAIDFGFDPAKGHKTGMYLDQQLNYQRVAELCADRDVLDCFTFQGGFALHAKRAGARSVTAVDQSEEALQAADQNAAINGLDGIEWIHANAFDWLKATSSEDQESRDQYDVVILDPPSFTRSRHNLDQATRGYKEIHLRALKLLKPDGVLITFCCSHHVDRDLFEETVVAAAIDNRNVLRRVAEYTQAPDHPQIPTIPETEYLKGFAYTVID